MDGGGGEGGGGGGEGDLASVGGGTEDGDAGALEGVALGGLEGVVVVEGGVINGGDDGGAGDGELNEVGGGGDGDSGGVGDGGADGEDIVPVVGELGAFSGEGDFCGCGGGVEFVGGGEVVVGGVAFCDGAEGAGGEGDLPLTRGVVGVAGFCAEGMVVEEEFDLIEVAVGADGFGVGGGVGGSPVSEAHDDVGAAGASGDGFHTDEVEDGLFGPPAFAFKGVATGEVGAVEHAGGGDDVGPFAGFAEVISAGPDELA